MSLVITKPTIIEHQTFYCGEDNTPVLIIQCSDVIIRNIKIICTGVNTTGILIDNKTPIENIVLENIHAEGLTTGIKDTNTVTCLYLRNIMFKFHKGCGLDLSHVFAFLYLDNVTVEAVGVKNTSTLFSLKNNQGCFFNRVVLACGNNGMEVINCEELHGSQLFIDTSNNIGLSLVNSKYIKLVDVNTNLINDGIVIDNCVDLQILGLYIRAKEKVSGTALKLIKSSYVKISNFINHGFGILDKLKLGYYKLRYFL